eukprot:12827683-Prorocentrum_lima.AAC.1
MGELHQRVYGHFALLTLEIRWEYIVHLWWTPTVSATQDEFCVSPTTSLHTHLHESDANDP